MRIRTIKPEFWTDSFMVGLPPLARLIFLSLFSVADDHGCFEDEVDRIAMLVMPREDPDEVGMWIDMFLASGRLELYANEDGKTFYKIRHWEDHQRVDKPGKSKISRESSRKVAIPLEVRRGVATKYGCGPGCEKDASCYYCGDIGKITWHTLSNGKPSAWVSFTKLELDHLEAEHLSGETSTGNIVLACRSCNRSKGTKHWVDFFAQGQSSRILANPRESSALDQGSGIRDQGSGIREGDQGQMAPPAKKIHEIDDLPGNEDPHHAKRPFDLASLTESEVIAMADRDLIPKEFAVEQYNTAMGKGGLDWNGVKIASWRHFIKGEWERVQRREKNVSKSNVGANGGFKNPRHEARKRIEAIDWSKVESF